jgi:hypothetical protein
MKYPEGFVVKGKKELVCMLKKSLYGMKQSPRMWYQKFDTYILGFGFVRSGLITVYIPCRLVITSFM